MHSFSEAISEAALPTHAPLTAILHSERANARLRLNDYDACLQDCDVAIYAEDDCKQAWLTKTSALHALERHEEAVQGMEQLIKMYEHDEVVKHWYEQAHFKLRRANRPDYYQILGPLQCPRRCHASEIYCDAGVPTVASEAEIKAAYKRAALVCHPDKHSDGTEVRTLSNIHP